MRKIFVSIRDVFNIAVACGAFTIVFLFGLAAPAEMCIRLFEHDILQDLNLNPLLGRQNVTDSRGYRYYRQTIFALKTESQFPKIQYDQLTIIDSLKNKGRGNKEILVGMLGQNKVIVKVSNPLTRPESAVLNEARWLMFLNKFGIGPEFFGLVRTPEGLLGIVMEQIEGEDIGSNQAPQKVHIRGQHLIDIQETGKKLLWLGIKYSPDIQFMLTAKGQAILIDPEYFGFEIPINSPFDPNLVPIDPEANIKRFLENLNTAMTKQTAVASNAVSIGLLQQQKLKQIELTMSRALGFAVKIKTEEWDSFLDIYVVDGKGVRIAELMVLYNPSLKSLSIDYIATRPYTHRGLGKNLLEAALVVYSDTELLRAQSLISANKAEFDKYLVGRTVPQAIRLTPMFKLFEKLGFSELIEDSISEQFAFSAKKPERRIILLN